MRKCRGKAAGGHSTVKQLSAAGFSLASLCPMAMAAADGVLPWTRAVDASMDGQAGAVRAGAANTPTFVIGNVAGDGTLNTLNAGPSANSVYTWAGNYASFSSASASYSIAPQIVPPSLSVPAGSFNISSPTSLWNVAFQGANNDFFMDQQTGQAASDLVGDSTHPVLYRYYDPSTTYGDHTHGMLYFRARIGGKNSMGSSWGPFDNVLSIGLDFNTAASPYGKMDMFVMLDVHNPTGTIGVAMAGTGANTSPDNTTVGSFLAGTTASVVRNTNTGIYNFQYVGAPDGPVDLESNGATDGWVSFGLPFNYVVSAAYNQMGLSITDATPIHWGFGTSTQPNSFNQDVNGTRTRTDTWTVIYDGEDPDPVGSDVYHPAVAAAIVPNPVYLGRVHAGGTFGTQSLTLGNAATDDGFAEKLNGSVGATTGDATGAGSVSLLPVGGTSTGISVGLGDTSTAGHKSGTVTVSLTSDGTGTSGNGATALPSQSIAVSGDVYSGLSTWNGAATSSWNNFSNWDTLGGVPGIDGALSRGHDTATFSESGLARNVVNLNGTSPEIKTLSLTATSGSYTIAQGTGGSLRMTGAGAGINVSGVHTIASPIQLLANTQVNVAGLSDRLTIAGQLQNIGDLTKTGIGALVLTNTNTATGRVIINEGSLRIASGASVAGAVEVNAAAWLQGSGAALGTLQLNDGGGVSPGSDFHVGALTLAAGPGAGTSHLAGGIYRLEIARMTGSEGPQDALRGTGFDTMNFGGVVAIDASPSNRLTLDLRSLTLDETAAGPLTGSDPSKSYSWTVLRAEGGIVGFDPSAFNIDATGFAFDMADLAIVTSDFSVTGSEYLLGGTFQMELSSDQKSLILSYAVPEPSILFTLSGVVIGGCWLRPRRRVEKEPKLLSWRTDELSPNAA